MYIAIPDARLSSSEMPVAGECLIPCHLRSASLLVSLSALLVTPAYTDSAARSGINLIACSCCTCSFELTVTMLIQLMLQRSVVPAQIAPRPVSWTGRSIRPSISMIPYPILSDPLSPLSLVIQCLCIFILHGITPKVIVCLLSIVTHFSIFQSRKQHIIV